MRTNDLEVLTQAADFAVKYGFLGVGLVLALLVAPAIYKLWNVRALSLGIAGFGIAFVVAFGSIELIQKTAPHLISSNRVLLGGVVLGVSDGFNVQVTSDVRLAGLAYIKREFDLNLPNMYNFPFILVSTVTPSCLAVAITNTNPNSEVGDAVFAINSISRDDMKVDSELVLHYRGIGSGKLQFWREYRAKRHQEPMAIKPLPNSEFGCESRQEQVRPPGWLSVGRAFAQGSSVTQSSPVMQDGGQIPSYDARLKSDDLFTRRAARIDLSREGEAAFAPISQFLETNNYRLQIGALVAFSEMPDDVRKKAPAELTEKAKRLLTHPDAAMRNAVQQVLR